MVKSSISYVFVITGIPAMQELRQKNSDTEKITINLGPVDLGQIDLLVQEGFYSNRSDFIRTAIRNQLTSHADVIRQTVSRKSLVLGLQQFSRTDLETVRRNGEVLEIQVLGMAIIAADVTPELALATIRSVSVLGVFQASSAVKAALAGRIH
jgi:Arc/MetJ-type ribon-helix-helix transcriptional regulator